MTDKQAISAARAAKDDFARDGVVKLSGVFDDEWIGLLREALETNLTEPGPYARYYTPEGRKAFSSETIATGSESTAIGSLPSNRLQQR
jgi:hypothetical protein